MRAIAAVTVSRADYGILRPVLRAITSAGDLQLQLIVAGTHLSSAHGRTIATITADGYTPAGEVDTVPHGDDPRAIADAMGRATRGFGDIYDRLQPEMVVLVGDRFETLAAAAAAVPFTTPIAHLHGGDVTEGAIDEQFRHAISKLSHLHFTATAASAARILQMGEEPWRIVVSGAPALDDVRTLIPWPRARLEEHTGIALDRAPLLVTLHPTTLEFGVAARHAEELTTALDQFDQPVIVSAPNVDTAHRAVREHFECWARGRPGTALVENLGNEAYWSLMTVAAAVVGNSSSGILEAASFKLPVVDIGNRQAGRERGANVRHAGHGHEEIVAALRAALSPAFREGLAGLRNPYGDGHASGRIVRKIQQTPSNVRLRVKRFHHVASVDTAPIQNH